MDEPGFYSYSPEGEDCDSTNDIVGPEAVARGTNVTSENDGKYMMGLTAEQFSTTNTNYDVSFDVTDGWLKITKKSISISLDSSKVYDGEIFTVTADQLHVTGLVEGQSLTGQLTKAPSRTRASTHAPTATSTVCPNVTKTN